jgi:hypothetical protein
MRGWVYRLKLLLVLPSAVILRSESRGTHDHILLSQIRDSSNLEDQVPRCPSTVDSVTSRTGLPNRCLALDVSAARLWLHTSGFRASCQNIIMCNKCTLIHLVRERFYPKQDNSGAESNSEVPEVLHEWKLRQGENTSNFMKQYFFRI